MAAPDLLTTVYATDENIAIRAGGDFAPLCPDWQKLASGSDGVFTAGSPWVLNSPSVDFEAAGVLGDRAPAIRTFILADEPGDPRQADRAHFLASVLYPYDTYKEIVGPDADPAPALDLPHDVEETTMRSSSVAHEEMPPG